MKTNKLTGAALDWAVAKCEGRTIKRNPMGPQGGHGWWIWEETPSGRGGILIDKSIYIEIGPRIKPKTRQSTVLFSPSTDWAQGGPIIEREKIDVGTSTCGGWRAVMATEPEYTYGNGPTPLIAAMRCYVASKMGDEIEIPEELTK